MQQYKTMVLQLIRQYPNVHYPLKEKKMLLATVEKEAEGLMARHEAWKDLLAQAKPGSDQSQIASEALEIAIHEWEVILAMGRLPSDAQLSLDDAMTFLKRATPTG